MTSEEFANGPAKSVLLKQEEKLNFFILICKTNKNDQNPPIPDGFSTSNVKRFGRGNRNPMYFRDVAISCTAITQTPISDQI